MKATKALTVILAIVSFVFAVASLAFMDWDKMGMNYEFHNQFKLFAALFAVLMVVVFAIILGKKNKFVILPLVGFVPTAFYFVKKLYDGMQFNQTVIDVVSPTENTSVLTLLLFAGFIACAVISAIKENKYTKFYTVGYLAFLILTTLKFLPDITMNKDLMPITFLAYSMVFGYAAFMIAFIPTCQAKENEACEKQEESKEETKEAE